MTTQAQKKTLNKKTVKKSANTITLSELNNKLTETLAKAAAMDEPAAQPQPVPMTGMDKQAFMVHLLLRPDGTTLKEMAEALGWKENSVRGAMSLYAKNHKGSTAEFRKGPGNANLPPYKGRISVKAKARIKSRAFFVQYNIF